MDPVEAGLFRRYRSWGCSVRGPRARSRIDSDSSWLFKRSTWRLSHAFAEFFLEIESAVAFHTNVSS